MISANNVSLEGVDYATAVQVLRDSGQTVDLVVKRRVVLPPTLPAPNSMDQPKYLNISLQRLKKKEDFGIVLGIVGEKGLDIYGLSCKRNFLDL